MNLRDLHDPRDPERALEVTTSHGARRAHDEEDQTNVAGARRAGLPWAYRFAEILVRPWLLLLTKRDWRGAENLPSEGGFVVSPNHISYADPLPFAHYMFDNGRPAYFLAKESVFRVRGVGWLLRKAGQIPVYRNSSAATDAFRAAVEGVRAGKPVAIFPEGTITRDPDLWPMRGKTGAARVALETRCPLIPVAQWGAQEILSPYGHRPSIFPRKTIRVIAGPPVDLTDLYGRPHDTKVLREATDRLMDSITTLLEQLREGSRPDERFDPRLHGVPEIGDPMRHEDIGRIARPRSDEKGRA